MIEYKNNNQQNVKLFGDWSEELINKHEELKPSHTDCKSEIGITVGIIDSIITLFTLLKDRNLEAFEIVEALEDLKNDKDVKSILL